MKSPSVIRGVATCGAVVLAHAQFALADSGESTPLSLGGAVSRAHAAAGGGGASIVRTIVGLAIVIAVIYGVAWVMRQAKAAKTRPVGRGLAQVATLPLGSGRAVSLVRVGGELVLLGVAEHGVTTIRTYTEEEALEAGLIGDEEPEFIDGAAAETPVGRLVDTLRRMTVRQ